VDQRIEHAGYKRDVISINPQYYTPEGEIVEDEEDIDDDDEPLDENIYKDIKLEGVLFRASRATWSCSDGILLYCGCDMDAVEPPAHVLCSRKVTQSYVCVPATECYSTFNTAQ
jgi:hypothetical protein